MEGLEEELESEMPKEYHLKNKMIALVIEDFIVSGAFRIEEDMTANLTKKLKETFFFYFEKIEITPLEEGQFTGYVKASGCPPLEFTWSTNPTDIEAVKKAKGL